LRTCDRLKSGQFVQGNLARGARHLHAGASICSASTTSKWRPAAYVPKSVDAQRKPAGPADSRNPWWWTTKPAPRNAAARGGHGRALAIRRPLKMQNLGVVRYSDQKLRDYSSCLFGPSIWPPYADGWSRGVAAPSPPQRRWPYIDGRYDAARSSPAIKGCATQQGRHDRSRVCDSISFFANSRILNFHSLRFPKPTRLRRRPMRYT